MSIQTNLLVMSCPTKSSDGLYHARYPTGNAPLGQLQDQTGQVNTDQSGQANQDHP